jgi:adenosine deaminase
VCPLSNVALKAVGSLAEHPLPDMLAAGLRVTVNSDDPAYFGGYLDDNVTAVRTELGLDDQQLAALAHNSFDACFAPEADKRRWKSEVDAALTAPVPGPPATTR